MNCSPLATFHDVITLWSFSPPHTCIEDRVYWSIAIATNISLAECMLFVTRVTRRVIVLILKLKLSVYRTVLSCTVNIVCQAESVKYDHDLLAVYAIFYMLLSYQVYTPSCIHSQNVCVNWIFDKSLNCVCVYVYFF